MNVLVTCAGRRTSLVRLFMEAVHPQGGLVFAGDASSLAPALAIADRPLRFPFVTSERYLDALAAHVQENRIRLVVPTIDTELALLCEGQARIEALGARVAISLPSFVELSADKWLTHLAFSAQGIDVPTTWLPEEFDASQAPEELFIKPRFGSASRDIHAVTRLDVATVLGSVDLPVVQERMTGPEITIDALFSLDDGVPLHYVPRLRIRTLGGESIQGRTIDDAELKSWLARLMAVAQELGARGPVTFQAFLSSRGPVLLEVNPRFGGGFPLADAAGGHYPAWLLDMVQGRAVRPSLGQYRRGLFMTRYSVEHFTDELPW